MYFSPSVQYVYPFFGVQYFECLGASLEKHPIKIKKTPPETQLAAGRWTGFHFQPNPRRGYPTGHVEDISPLRSVISLPGEIENWNRAAQMVQKRFLMGRKIHQQNRKYINLWAEKNLLDTSILNQSSWPTLGQDQIGMAGWLQWINHNSFLK